jgi:hypothetical protein
MKGVKLQRVNEKSSPEDHYGLDDWNLTDKNFMKQLYDNDLADDMRYLSKHYRVSNYCIEGERGFTYKCMALTGKFYNGLKHIQHIIDKVLITASKEIKHKT